MSRGALALSTYPFDQVRIRCDLCGRAGRYNRGRLIARFGAQMSMPELLGRMTADCPERRALFSGSCQAIYPDLAMRNAREH